MLPVGDPDVHAVVLHRRIEEFFEHGPQPVHLVDEQDVARAERGEHADQIARALEHRARRRADVDAQLFRHEQGEGRLAQARWSEEQRMIERLVPLLRRVDRDLQGFLHFRLADEFVQPRRTEGGVGEPLVGQGVRRSDLRARPIAHAALFPSGRARQRTGRTSRSSA